MFHGPMLLAAGLLAALAGGLVRGLVHTQRLGPGAAHPEQARLAPPLAARRAVMRWATLGALAVAATQAGLVVVRFAWPARAGGVGAEVAIPWRQLPPPGGPPLRHEAGRFYLMHNAEGLLAFSWVCTHLGCTVPWRPAEGRFHCPCHQSQFDRQGRVLAGPATRPLDLMPLQLAADAVVVDTGTIIRRADFEPGQVTRLA
jgi:cytochrome b6-f complex iron-sulfur subunit